MYNIIKHTNGWELADKRTTEKNFDLIEKYKNNNIIKILYPGTLNWHQGVDIAIKAFRKIKEIIPKIIIDKPPSAELSPNQTDQDVLPPYDLLDKILKMYLEENKEFKEISSVIGDDKLVKKVLRMVDINEFMKIF